jgi:S1-C subfamily serine protease
VRGVAVNAVTSKGPAERAGVRPGDVIVAFDGQRIDDGNTLRNLVASTPPGTKVNLTLIRDGREQQLPVTVGEYQPAKGRG